MSTTIVGERFFIYACKAKATPVPIWSDDLRAGTPPAWMIELAEQVKHSGCASARRCRARSHNG
jgi:hypothetical protein